MIDDLPFVDPEDFIDIGVNSFDPTRPEFDPLEAITIKAIPLPRLVCWDGIIASDDFYEAPTGSTPSGQLRWASFGRMQTGGM